jgi:hypothetical protein
MATMRVSARGEDQRKLKKEKDGQCCRPAKLLPIACSDPNLRVLGSHSAPAPPANLSSWYGPMGKQRSIKSLSSLNTKWHLNFLILNFDAHSFELILMWVHHTFQRFDYVKLHSLNSFYSKVQRGNKHEISSSVSQHQMTVNESVLNLMLNPLTNALEY